MRLLKPGPVALALLLSLLCTAARADTLRVTYDLTARFDLVEDAADVSSPRITMGSGLGSMTFLYEVNAMSQVLQGNILTLENLTVQSAPMNFVFMGDNFTGELGLILAQPIANRTLDFFGGFNLAPFTSTLTGFLHCNGTCTAAAGFPNTQAVPQTSVVATAVASGALFQPMMMLNPQVFANLRTGSFGAGFGDPVTVGGWTMQFIGVGTEISRETVPEPRLTLLLLASPLAGLLAWSVRRRRTR